MADTQISKIKRRLGISDETQDELLKDLIDDAQSHFMAITGAEEVLPKYNFIVNDVVVLRYNRRGSEGMESESVDGYSVKYETDDFKKYQWILDRDFGEQSSSREKGKVKFI